MRKRVLFGLAGLQTGVTGALAMLVWLAVGSLFTRHSVWWVPNLVAAAFYGQGSVRNGPGIYSAAGIATVLVAYGLAGVVFAEFQGTRGGGFRVLCLALIGALAIHWGEQRWFWDAANPVGGVYAPIGQILFAHILFGFVLSGYARVLRGMRGVIG